MAGISSLDEQALFQVQQFAQLVPLGGSGSLDAWQHVGNSSNPSTRPHPWLPYRDRNDSELVCS